MVSFASPFGAIVSTGLVGINSALSELKRRHCKYAVIEPIWSGTKTVVNYEKWMRQNCEHDGLLSEYDWPVDLRAGWSSWGGTKPRQLGILTRLVNNKRNVIVPVAYGVQGSVAHNHNALLTRNLLIGHGFTTGAGWYKCVDVNSSLETLSPMSNALKLPVPRKWRVIAL